MAVFFPHSHPQHHSSVGHGEHADDDAMGVPEVLELPEHDGRWTEDLTLLSMSDMSFLRDSLADLQGYGSGEYRADGYGADGYGADGYSTVLEAGPASDDELHEAMAAAEDDSTDDSTDDEAFDDDEPSLYFSHDAVPDAASAQGQERHASGPACDNEDASLESPSAVSSNAFSSDEYPAEALSIPPRAVEADDEPLDAEDSQSGIVLARRSIMDMLTGLWEEQNPRFLSQMLWFARRVHESVRPRFLSAVFALVSHHPRATAAVIASLSRLGPVLDETGQKQLVRACARAQERLPFQLRVSLLQGLLKAGRVRLAQGLVMHELSRGPAQECAHWLLAISRQLSPSVFRKLDLNRMVERCLERLGPSPSMAALEPLMMVVDPRRLKDEDVREIYLLTVTRALKPELLHVRHRERLFFLQRMTDLPALRARLMVLHDLAHMSLIGPDVGIPQMVLGMLPHFPQVLEQLPEEEVGLVVRFILRRLFRRLTEQDHELIVERLCSLTRPQPFIQAYFAHLESVGRKLAGTGQLELWSEVFQAWLPRHMSQYREHAEPQLQAIIKGLDKDVRRELTQILKRRFGKGQKLLSLELDEEKQGWLRPWFRGQRQPL